MKKAIIIHGTGGHSGENWFPWLKTKLEEKGLEVFVPDFPGASTPNLEDWHIEFAKYSHYIDEETILIGHSLGGTFLLKFLEKFKGEIGSIFFVASPVGVKPIKYYDGDLKFVGNFDFDWDKLRSICREVQVYHSDNDEFVCLENGTELSKQLGVKLNFIPDSGHFNESTGYVKFDRLLTDIEKVL